MYEEKLMKCKLFHNFTLEEVKGVTCNTAVVYKQYPKEAFITYQGDPTEGIGIVLEGKALITKNNPIGERLIVGILGPGNLFGEVIAFADVAEWPASIVAQTDVVVAFLNKEIFVKECITCCSAHQKMLHNMLSILSNSALNLNKKLDYLTIGSLRSKISKYLLELYKEQQSMVLSLPMDRTKLAEFLCVARPSLSRELAKMRDDGIIDFYKSSIKINALDQLRQS